MRGIIPYWWGIWGDPQDCDQHCALESRDSLADLCGALQKTNNKTSNKNTPGLAYCTEHPNPIWIPLQSSIFPVLNLKLRHPFSTIHKLGVKMPIIYITVCFFICLCYQSVYLLISHIYWFICLVIKLCVYVCFSSLLIYLSVSLS